MESHCKEKATEVRSRFEVFYPHNQRDEFAALDAVLSSDNRKGHRAERVLACCEAVSSDSGQVHSIEIDFAGPKPPTGAPGSDSGNKVISVTIRSDDTSWATRSLAGVEEQLERTFQSFTRPVLFFVGLVIAALLFVLFHLPLARTPGDHSWSMWLNSDDREKVQHMLEQNKVLTDEEDREVLTMQLKNVLEDRRAFQAYQVNASKPLPIGFLYFLIPLVIVLSSGVYLFARCYPFATFKWGDETARHNDLLQQRTVVWGIIVAVAIVGVAGNALTMALFGR